jgi:non-homologous end joining protein Ku
VEEPARVVDLMEALKRSLDSVSAHKKRPAKADLAKDAAPKAVKGAAQGARKRKAS